MGLGSVGAPSSRTGAHSGAKALLSLGSPTSSHHPRAEGLRVNLVAASIAAWCHQISARLGGPAKLIASFRGK